MLCGERIARESERELAVSFGTTDWLHMTPILHDIVFLWFTTRQGQRRMGRNGSNGRTDGRDDMECNRYRHAVDSVLFWDGGCLTLPLLLLVGGRWIECHARLQPCPPASAVAPRHAGRLVINGMRTLPTTMAL